jgi:hypothetical protein
VTRTPVLQISTTVHMALVQGIYDLGEPGREAKQIELRRLLILDHALRLDSEFDRTTTLDLFTARCTAESQYLAVRSSGALYAGFPLREMLLHGARSIAT